ncbi:hypothetical protein D3C85_694490 [compost metagenome]
MSQNTDALHTVRGVTGTIPELIQAFGVQVGASTVYMRRCKYGWSWERCLLYSARKPPLRADDPWPIPARAEPEIPWQRATREVKRRYDCGLHEALLGFVSLGCSRDDLSRHLGLTITPQHYRGLRRRTELLKQTIERGITHV